MTRISSIISRDDSSRLRRRRFLLGAFASVGVMANTACFNATEPDRVQRPQTVVLFATPKIIEDFANPAPSVAAFLDHYEPLIARADTTILIYSVGNSDHILNYEGAARWNVLVEWARLTDGQPVSSQILDYHGIDRTVRAFREYTAARDIPLRIYDQIDSGNEFTITNQFKYNRHPECIANEWESFDVAARLLPDTFAYATAPNGTPAGVRCGEFAVNQMAVYLDDLGFDGILFDNQFGTRGRWLPDNGPGYSDVEAAEILLFFAFARAKFGSKGIMWFDSYNEIAIERDTYSFPRAAYAYFDYLIASGFCVITTTDRYRRNLESKLSLGMETKVLASLDYVDPWYTYNSMTEYPLESASLESIAVRHRFDVDGIVFFSNDDHGDPVPLPTIQSFANRFYR